MAMTLETLHKLVALDPNDPLSRFALGKKLFETSQNLPEAADHLRFANRKDPGHLATYLILSKTLVALGERSEARDVLHRGIDRASLVTEGMGRDLAPLMRDLLQRITTDEAPRIDVDIRLAAPGEVVDLRHRVLRVGMPREAAIFPGDDSPTTLHALARVGGVPACCATMMRDAGASALPPEVTRLTSAGAELQGVPTYRLRGMATEEGFRSLRLGHGVLSVLESAVLDRHEGESGRRVLLWCNARIGAVRFYLREGWEVLSASPYDVPTAGLHQTMAKRIGRS